MIRATSEEALSVSQVSNKVAGSRGEAVKVERRGLILDPFVNGADGTHMRLRGGRQWMRETGLGTTTRFWLEQLEGQWDHLVGKRWGVGENGEILRER